MHGFLAGIMGLFMGITSMFHGGNGMPPANHTDANVSGAEASGSGTMWHGRGMKLPNGERPFFGMVTSVNGSAITVQMQLRRMYPNPSIIPTMTPPPPMTVTVDLTSTTKYTGGSASDITTNTRVAGVGTINSDGSITAINVQINPPMPTGFPPGGFHHGFGGHGYPAQGNYNNQ